MAEKTDEVMSMPVGIQDRGNEREPERKRRETTFDVYVGKIPSDWTKVCVAIEISCRGC